MKFRNIVLKYGPSLAAVGSLVLAGVASADISADATTMATYISGTMTTAFGVVATAVLTLYGAIMAYKVVKRFLR